MVLLETIWLGRKDQKMDSFRSKERCFDYNEDIIEGKRKIK